MKLARRLILTTTAIAAVTVGTLLSATVGQATTSKPAPAPADANAAPKVPDALKVPDGNRLTGVFSAKGVQTYTCTDGAWKLLEPAATLAARNDSSHRPVASTPAAPSGCPR